MRRCLQGIAVLICLLPFVAGHSTGAEVAWPGFRGPHSDGSVPGADLFGGKPAALSVGWQRTLGSGYSAVVVGDGRVVTLFTDGDADVIAAFDSENGEELWRYRIADAYAGHDGSHDGPISTPLLTSETTMMASVVPTWNKSAAQVTKKRAAK